MKEEFCLKIEIIQKNTKFINLFDYNKHENREQNNL